MYDSSLDPFGDGSLTQSWTFNTSGESVQGGNTFSNFGIGEGLFDDGMIDRPTDTDQITSLGHGVDGDVNLSFVYWFKAGYKSSSVSKDWHNFFFGGNDQRYNVWVRVAGTAVSTTRTYLSGGIHKNGESSVKSVSNLDNNSWHMVGYTYESSTQLSKFYLDGVLEITLPALQMKFLDAKPIVFMGGTYHEPVDQFMQFNKTLSVAEINDLYNNMQATPPPTSIDVRVQTVNANLIPSDVQVISNVLTGGSSITSGGVLTTTGTNTPPLYGTGIITSEGILTTIGVYTPPLYGISNITSEGSLTVLGKLKGVIVGAGHIISSTFVTAAGRISNPVILYSESKFKVHQSIEFRLYRRAVLQKRITNRSKLAVKGSWEINNDIFGVFKLINQSNILYKGKLCKRYIGLYHLQANPTVIFSGKKYNDKPGQITLNGIGTMLANPTYITFINEQLVYMEELMEEGLIKPPPAIVINGDFLLPEDIEPFIRKDRICLLQTQ